MAAGLVLLCGRAFSGKSTVATALARSLPGSIVSLDAINLERGLDGGSGIPVAEWARTNDVAYQRVTAALSGDETVIVDDTCSLRFLRDRWREAAAELGAVVALVYVDAKPETIRRRQTANRLAPTRPDVTDQVLSEHLADFEPPAADESALRFDADVLDMAQVTAAVAATLARPDTRSLYGGRG